MKALFESFLLCLLLLWPGHAQAQALPTVRVVVFGDSLTAGYQIQPEEAFPARLERKIKEMGFTNVDVINMSVTGETAAEGAGRIGDLLQQRPDIVVLALGTNDAMSGIGSNIINFNLTRIVEAVQKTNAYVVLVGAKAPPRLGLDYAAQLDDMYRGLAASHRLPLYPYILDGISGHQSLSLADGLHPNSKGVDVMVSRIYPLVDTGLRWKEQTLQYQQAYKQYQQQQEHPVP